MRAEVSLLSRNIQIVGQRYSKMDTQAFGARVLVGTMSQDGKSYKGRVIIMSIGLIGVKFGTWGPLYNVNREPA